MRGGDVMVEAQRRKDKEERRGVEAVQAAGKREYGDF